MAGIELAFVEWLAQRQAENPRVLLGVGDDMAMIDVNGERVFMASDMILDGVHFDSKEHSLHAIGRKAIACNLSDCAAMAVEPVAATVSLALPSTMGLLEAQELFHGMREIAGEFELAIAGGDTTVWDKPLAIDVAILARPFPGFEPVRRSEARVGDAIFVTGPLGGSSLGRHLTFVPRVREAQALAQQLGGRLHALMDISDGLSLDLWRMCQASGVGAMLDETRLRQVISEDAVRMAKTSGKEPLEHALSDGEDFELLLAVDPSGSGFPPGITRVGEITAGDFCIRRSDGRIEALAPRGYVH